jgi:putative addiction module component (TIGR02574 family)
MSPKSRHILSDALELPPIERAELVEKILASFEFPSRKKIDALWAREAERRLAAFEQGKIKAVPAKDVFDKIEKRWK